MATIFDLLEVTSIAAHTTYSTSAGTLLGVVDNVSSSDLNDGEFDEGDDILIGGVSYNIDVLKEPSSSGNFTLGDGSQRPFNPGSESNLDVIFMTVSNGGDVRHFVIPNDSYGNMNVKSIRTGEINDVGGSDAAVISTSNNSVNVVCFVAGALLATPEGEIAVETIKVGDFVQTRDNGPQRVRKILVRELDFSIAPDRYKPIKFERNSLGAGRPYKPLLVSPQHRMLVVDQNGQSILVPAKSLTSREGVRVACGKRHVTYIHLVFSRHEIIQANGTETESFFPGVMAMRAVSETCAAEIRDIFGHDMVDGVDATHIAATPILRFQQAKRQALTFM